MILMEVLNHQAKTVVKLIEIHQILLIMHGIIIMMVHVG